MIVGEVGPEDGIENVMKILMIYQLTVVVMLYSHILHPVLIGNNKVLTLIALQVEVMYH